MHVLPDQTDTGRIYIDYVNGQMHLFTTSHLFTAEDLFQMNPLTVLRVNS